MSPSRPNPRSRSAGTRPAPVQIAYLSMEIGLESTIRTYSGGLGVLAGDTLRSAADLELPVVGVTLAHREGYFRQTIDDEGRQHDGPDPWSPEGRLEEAERRVTIRISGRDVRLRAWRYPIEGLTGHRVPVYLLDSDLEENHADDRALTDRLYGGDPRHRLRQEAVLGLGGAALLRALGHRSVHTHHMNEGHSALLPLALLEERGGRGGAVPTSADDVEAVRRRSVFTTHTPVPAGHDRFREELVREVLGDARADAALRLGGEDGKLNMSLLALALSRYANGVAMRHGQVSREMFPGYEIRTITNGVHVPTWTAPSVAELFDREIPGWRRQPENLRHAVSLPVEGLREAREGARDALFRAVSERAGVDFDPEALTVGFARRATPYKRAALLFRDLERLRAMTAEHGPLQVVYAGKAHPRDETGQEGIRRVHEAAKELEGEVPVVWLEDYDMDDGLLITAGVDLWLNNPRRPLEASGTSGMKAALNGVPNLSVLDGWWIEGHVEGVTGWSIGDEWRGESDDTEDAEALYHKLEGILQLYHDRPDDYDRVRRSAIALNGSFFTARRMMQQYLEEAYRPPTAG